MKKTLRLEKDNRKIEDNIFKNLENLFRLKKEIVTPRLKIKYIF